MWNVHTSLPVSTSNAADVAGWRVVALAGSRTEHEQIAPHLTGRSRLRATGGQRGAAEPLAQVHEAVGAEARDRLPRSRIELLKVAARREDEAAIGAVVVFPVVEAAVGRRAFGIEPPDFLPRHGIEREHRAVLADDVHHVVDDERAEGEPADRARRGKEPLQLELMNVALVDLLECRVLRAFDAAAGLAPGRVQPRPALTAKVVTCGVTLQQPRRDDERESRSNTHISLQTALSTQRKDAKIRDATIDKRLKPWANFDDCDSCRVNHVSSCSCFRVFVVCACALVSVVSSRRRALRAVVSSSSCSSCRRARRVFVVFVSSWLPDRDRRHGRSRRALDLQRLDDERELVHLLAGQLVELQVLEQMNAMDDERDLMHRVVQIRIGVGRDARPARCRCRSASDPVWPATRRPRSSSPGFVFR